MRDIGPVQSNYREGSPVGRRSQLRWVGFVEKVRFEPGLKERWMTDNESGDDEKDGLTSEREVNRDKTGEADELNLEVGSTHTRSTASNLEQVANLLC